MIEAKNLVKFYGPVQALGGVSFGLQPGEVVGLLGPNGAGKSTALRILTGYLPPTAGHAILDGIDNQADPLEARRRLGYLSENNPLYDSLGVWESLELFAALREIPAPHRRRRIAEVAGQCGIGDVLGKDVGELSKGYRQRLGLALAILHDPRILILDEPTSALDPNQQKEVRDLILQLKEKKTVLLSTHILSEAQKICDRLVIIHKGRIAAQGTVAELRAGMEGASFHVRLKAPATEAAEMLMAVPGVSAATLEDEEEPGCPRFAVTAEGDARPDLARAVVKKGWPLLELGRRGASLDEIFESLTEKK
jgi:ABC-2 type transport system ATP-binding protein